jgi:Restriction alleviation protein Lar
VSDRDFENMGRQRGEWLREHLQQAPLTDPRDERLAGAVACPFCGSRNLSLSRTGTFVHCDGCGADGPEVPYERYGDAWRQALARWNARQPA